jgi:hypothetical protein
MKRAVALILLVCLALTLAVAGYVGPSLKKMTEGAASPTPTAKPLATATPKAAVTTAATATVKPTPRATAVVAPTPFPGTVVDEADPQAAKYRGTWDTILGKMTFTVNGRHVHGEYAFENGIVEATLSDDGKTLAGTWYEEPTLLPPRDSGKCIFTISEDGNVIHGEWWYGDGEYGGVWDGVRIS